MDCDLGPRENRIQRHMLRFVVFIDHAWPLCRRTKKTMAATVVHAFQWVRDQYFSACTTKRRCFRRYLLYCIWYLVHRQLGATARSPALLVFAWKFMKASVEVSTASMEASISSMEAFTEASMEAFTEKKSRKLPRKLSKASMEITSTKASTETSMKVVEDAAKVTSTEASTEAFTNASTSTKASTKAWMEASTEVRPR